MMSKNSFWANMRENLKRRNWIAVIYSVVFLLTFPVGLSLWFASSNSQKEWMTMAEWKEDMMIGLSGYLSINVGMTVLITVMAVICAIQGFSYLFRRQKMDMYMSVPISKERRFAVIYLNGILLFAVTYLVSLLIGLCISAGNGILTAEIVKSMLYSYIAYIIYYTVVYNITIIAVMLTGNLLVSFCATGVFLFYEIAVKALFVGLCYTFLHTYSGYTTNDKVYASPVVMMFEKSVFSENAIVSVPRLIEQTGMTMVKIFIIAIVTGIVGYVLYARRPAESCNRAIAFTKTKPVIKVAIMVPISIVVGVVFYSVSDGSIAMTLFGFIIGILLSHCMMEIIFAFDLKAAVKHLVSGAVGAVLVFGIFAVFYFDLTGYDKWVPEPEKVESIAIDLPVVYGTYYDIEDGYWIDSAEYSFEHMELTDTEKICAFMKSVMADSMKDTAEGIGADSGTEEGKMLWATVKYRMKNGSEKYRSVHFLVDEYLEELNSIVASEEYRNGAYQIMDEEFNSKIKLKSIEFNNGVLNKKVAAEDMETVYENYKSDLEKYDLKTIVDDYPIGVVYFEFEMPGKIIEREETIMYSMPVYESFEKTKAYTDENECLKDWRLDADSISVITISYWDEKTYESKDVNYTDKEDIEAILPALNPGILANYRYFMEEYDYSYDAYVSFKESPNEEWEYSSWFQVDSSLLPEFAK